MGPTIIGIGLTADHPSIVEDHPAMTPEVIKKGLQKTEADCTGAGYDYHEFFINPEDDFKRLTDELKARRWDGVVIGFGVRGNPKLTVFFERIVNTVIECAPQAKFIFNYSPDSTLEGAKRQLPIS
ncbi:hypothetical protein FRB94_006624 [Tulasnella sp. JGI-2019a]|nr:hypothetical protein FRB93_001919 [Tulasnella sp. JGI-2019a]KAG8998823.1 hypothetical protein FRB94_006624 [Tulasnella sp. JGI-2019a]KAG9030437.1 hypothetical protein FRB95_003943 [Tulasnella sp. JGI-2019a]